MHALIELREQIEDQLIHLGLRSGKQVVIQYKVLNSYFMSNLRK
ncbi:protein of unknown function [Paenibacillus alvei]|uniref:Uncharacterized protein n=1 Tax=Paenibacillus alvei TaxID=44250 RepID=A0A383REJ2_PAEAL|nr:protein of unknown function [Paenibacillus alvei]